MESSASWARVEADRRRRAQIIQEGLVVVETRKEVGALDTGRMVAGGALSHGPA